MCWCCFDGLVWRLICFVGLKSVSMVLAKQLYGSTWCHYGHVVTLSRVLEPIPQVFLPLECSHIFPWCKTTRTIKSHCKDRHSNHQRLPKKHRKHNKSQNISILQYPTNGGVHFLFLPRTKASWFLQSFHRDPAPRRISGVSTGRVSASKKKKPMTTEPP